MHKPTLLVTPKEIMSYVGSIWRTEIFKDSHNHGYIHDIVADFARIPRIFYEMDVPHIETSHFTTWMNAIARRNHYTNAGIHDLYYLHEIVHAQRMTYDSSLPWHQWYTKMVTNEFHTSLETEVFVYFELPELRAQTFLHEIWGDRFLTREYLDNYNDPSHRLGNDRTRRREYFKEYVRQERKRAMSQPDPFDYLELQIANYLEQNQEWARVWVNSYQEVERQMETFLRDITEKTPHAALILHLEWFKQKQDQWESSIPYDTEARAFARVYEKNKKLYGNQNIESKLMVSADAA